MVDVLRKRVAPAHRVIVDSKAFLNTEFNDAVLFLTGGHIELMRNLMQYANRRSTWVSDYYIGYYLEPTDADWNLIQQSVAELEYVLMGNNNVIFGYNERIHEWLGGTKTGAGQYNALSTAVPAGYVHRIEAISIRNVTGTRGGTGIFVIGDATYYAIKYDSTPVIYIPLLVTGCFTLEAGDQVNVRMAGCLDGDVIEAGLWGYRMEVPT